MEPLITILLGVIGSLLAAEIWANAPRLGRWLIKHAILKLPASKRDHYHEEWLSHLDECTGAIGKLGHALGCYFRAARELAAPRASATEKALVEVAIKIVVRFGTLPDVLPLLVRGKFRNTRLIWKLFDYMAMTNYWLRKFGATDADFKVIRERFNSKLRVDGKVKDFKTVLAACADFGDAALEIKKRRTKDLSHDL